MIILGIIDNDLNNIRKQFISVTELLEFVADIDNCSIERAAAWLHGNQYILRRTKALFSGSEFALADHSECYSTIYRCPIQTIMLISLGEDCSIWSDDVGFARKRLLIDLKQSGFNIADELIRNTPVYISQYCSDDDDNFYKNQCIDLNSEVQQAPSKEPTRTQKNEIQFINFLDQNNTQYNARITLVARINHDMSHLGRYSDERIHWKRIKLFLNEYGASYGFTATDTHAQAIAQILPSRESSRIKAEEIVKNILRSE